MKKLCQLWALIVGREWAVKCVVFAHLGCSAPRCWHLIETGKSPGPSRCRGPASWAAPAADCEGEERCRAPRQCRPHVSAACPAGDAVRRTLTRTHRGQVINLDCQDVHDVNKEIYGLTVNRRAVNLKNSLSERCLIGNSAHKPWETTRVQIIIFM